MKRIHYKFVFLIFLFFSFISFVRAEILFLKNGEVYYGKLIKENDDIIEYIPEAQNKPQIYPRKDILRVLYINVRIKSVYIYKKDGSMVQGFIVEEDADKITVRKVWNNTEELKIMRSDINSISEKKLKKTSLPFTFKLNKKAYNISIEGDFTGWKSTSMENNGNSWEKKIEIDILKKNEYTYHYIIDNKPEEFNRKIRFLVKEGTLLEDIDLLRPMFSLQSGLAYPGFDPSSKKFDANSPIFLGTIKLFNPFFMNKNTGLEIFAGFFSYDKILIDYIRQTNHQFSISNIPLLINFFYENRFPYLPFPLYYRIKTGAGLLIQNIRTSGTENSSTSRSAFSFDLALDIAFPLRDTLDLIAGYRYIFDTDAALLQFQFITLGVGFKL